MLIATLLLPLFTGITLGTAGRYLGNYGSFVLSLFSSVLCAIMAILLSFGVLYTGAPITYNAYSWLLVGSLEINASLALDGLSAFMLAPIVVITGLVITYSVGYMESDPHPQRFLALLSFFLFCIQLLVLADGFIPMFIGWELVGLASYLLITFWYTKIEALKAGMNALLFNRVGDVLLLIAFMLTSISIGDLTIPMVNNLAYYINPSILTFVGISLLIGACAKSAQFFLFNWLPSSMQAPTPVSSLLHSAAMVVAGVYLLARMSTLLELDSTTLSIAIGLSCTTVLMAGTIGITQNDLKRVVAFSTISQLGMMVVACGMSSYNLALFHMIGHAWFKCLLFLGAGALIHGIADQQDIRRTGALASHLPLTQATLLAGGLSLMAFPFLTGYYSKDPIIEFSMGSQNALLYFLLTVGAFCTALYSVRMHLLAFYVNPTGSKYSAEHSHESGILITGPMVFLALFGIYFGYFFKDHIGLGSSLINVTTSPTHLLTDAELSLDIVYRLIPFGLGIIGMIIIYSVYELKLFKVYPIRLHRMAASGYWLNYFYNRGLIWPTLYAGYTGNKQIDKGTLELLGPTGLSYILYPFGSSVAKIDTGLITNYALVLFASLAIYTQASWLAL